MIIELSNRWNVGVDLVNDIDTVEEDLTSGLVNKDAVDVVNIDSGIKIRLNGDASVRVGESVVGKGNATKDSSCKAEGGEGHIQ